MDDAAKTRLRAEMAARRKAVTKAQASAAAERVAAQIQASDVWAMSQRTVLYAALPDELPTQPLFECSRQASRAVLWSRLDGEHLVFVECVQEALVRGRYGILEPPRALAPSALRAGDLLIVPGVAFDSEGRRLGRGGGYYDRVLASLAEGACSVGIGYEFQRVKQVPTLEHDIPVQYVVTEWTMTQRSLP